MNHDAMEALMEAIMNESDPKAPTPKSTPAPNMSKRWIAALMLVAALFGALVTGLIRHASGPPSVKPMNAVGAKQGEPTVDVFFLGIGRYRN